MHPQGRQGDAERTRAALELASGSGDPFAEDMLQRRKTRIIRRRILVTGGALLLGLLLSVLLFHGSSARRPSHEAGVAHWRTVAGPAAMIVGFVLEGVVLVVRFRSGQIKYEWRSPSLVLSRGQRRQLLRQIRGRAAVDPGMLPVSRRLAETLANQGWVIGLLIALPLIFLGRALHHDDPFRWWLAVVLTTTYAVLSVPIVRDSLRGKAFLASYPLYPTGPLGPSQPWA